MAREKFIHWLLNPRNWWLPLLLIFTVSIAGVLMIGIHTYTEAPPVPDYVSESGTIVYRSEDILKGQAVFQQYALMDYGSMFGDGANRGPDFSAEALHRISVAMERYYQESGRAAGPLSSKGIEEQVRSEIKENRYDPAVREVKLTDAQVYAAEDLLRYHLEKFTGQGPEAFKPAGYLTDSAQIRSLSAFFFWGAWVCGTERPGKHYSYTHNWPFDPKAGNTPSPAIIFWSVIGSLGLLIGLGLVLFYHGRLEKLDDKTYTNSARPFMTSEAVGAFRPEAVQRAAFPFFYAAILVFGVQVLAGILTVHDFVGFVRFFGFDLSKVLPVTVTRSWHVQLSLLWISACWIGASIFVMPMLSPAQPRGQRRLIRILTGLTILLVAGSFAGLLLGPKGILGQQWYWLGHQGWEYMEMGKVWEIVLGVVFVLWAAILYRGVRPVMTLRQPWALPNWLVYASASIILLLVSGFIATPKTNFVIADFWRWMVVHMWAEAFFEVFTTVLIGYFMVLMGLVSRQAAIRVIYLATLLFLGSGLLGISHNFYWNGKPVFTMALGSVFSTLQVVPLVLLTLEAYRFSKLPRLLENNGAHGGTSIPAVDGGIRRSKTAFGFHEVFLFLLGVNFWNFFGAGVLGFVINLPIANYYEHGTYLTVNHGHAALMGVYGNLSLAAVLFCCRLLFRPQRWNPRLVRTVFWSINGGLLLMVLLDLFPAGIYQLNAVTENGLWYARSGSFIESPAFQTLTWMRIAGGALFTCGGVAPLIWFLVSRRKAVKRASPEKVSCPLPDSKPIIV
jgi:nitric oxide reductase subunit B